MGWSAVLYLFQYHLSVEHGGGFLNLRRAQVYLPAYHDNDGSRHVDRTSKNDLL